MEGRLALDTVHVTLEFDGGDGDREQIAHLYRVGRILRHVSADGRVSIEAEVPRRVLDRFPSAVVQRVMRPPRRADRDAAVARARARRHGSGVRGACARRSRSSCRRRAGAPKYPDFVFPAAPARLAPPAVAVRHQVAWQWLQAGDLRAAERNFSAALKEAPAFYPSEAGLGYVGARARTTTRRRRRTSTARWRANPAYAPALAGRGGAADARRARAGARSFEAAIAADPQLVGAPRAASTSSGSAGLQNDVDAARKAAEAGRLAEAHALYDAAIAASPDSPFLYRELAVVERREGNLAAALEHAQKAARAQPVRAAQLRDHRGDLRGAGRLREGRRRVRRRGGDRAERGARRARSTSCASGRRSRRCRRSTGRSRPRRPSPARSSPRSSASGSTTSSAARARANAVVMTDTRGQLGGAVDPVGLARRPDGAVSQPHVPAERPGPPRRSRAGRQPRAGAHRRRAIPGSPARGATPAAAFPDVAPGHLSYPAASRRVSNQA